MSLSSTSVSIAFLVLVCGSATAACSSSSPATATTGDAAITVFPTKVFLGVDETGKALGSAPVSLTGGAATATWASASTTIATATGNTTNGKIVGVKAGTSTVTVKSGTKSATIAVTVATYTAADATAGKTEYTTGKCDDCHGAAGTDITPSDLGKHTDAEILGAVVDGMNPEGGAIEGMHKFTATKAIVAYLRGLPARNDTPVDDK